MWNGPDPEERPMRLAHGRFIAVVLSGVELPGFYIADMVGEGHGEQVPTHTHESGHVSFILCGSYCTGARGLAGFARPGTVIYDPPGTTHADRFSGAGGRFLTISLTQDRVDEIYDLDRLPECSWGLAEREIGFLGTRLAWETVGADGFSSLSQEALVLELLGALERRAAPQRTPEPSWLRSACDFLAQSSSGPVTIRRVAEVVDVHPVHLARVFRQYRGCTPGQYLRGLRVERAMHEILAGRSLAEVAHACGFADQSMLTKSIRRVLGRTPGAYRSFVRGVQRGFGAG